MSKPLIAILSCVLHELNGFNDAIRNTWAPDCQSAGIDYKFFIGGSNSTDHLPQSYSNRPVEFQNKKTKDPDISLMSMRPDHVILGVSDKYSDSCFKFQAALAWSIENNYSYIFVALTDTFVAVDRLLSSGYQNQDYTGTANNERTAIGGGPGIWFSRKASEILVASEVDDWLYDNWAGIKLAGNAQLHHDPRYGNRHRDTAPHSSNDMITSHIANSPEIYDSAVMYSMYKSYKESL